MVIVVVSNKEHKKHNVKRRLNREIVIKPTFKTNPQQL